MTNKTVTLKVERAATLKAGGNAFAFITIAWFASLFLRAIYLRENMTLEWFDLVYCISGAVFAFSGLYYSRKNKKPES